ncbi:hypothetical protein QMK17_12165 [Rhodococcus sp. G-MC3]|uniref:hypothetical protein n=1 Tax=Rhodococcus sp. G-MC3 TaxID=3046209 RepID=UPI0024BA5B09|nr:hypothetical protein [Rhodococcus sp. G-MC3]MDJ0394083.1 hypothetical protein [Rhodococcus sp. G-MC3]
MIHLPAELSLFLTRLDTEQHLQRTERYRLARARRRAEHDQVELERAWRALDIALRAESDSRRELFALTQ